MQLVALPLLLLALSAENDPCALTPPVRKNLEDCLGSFVSFRVGIHGTFVVHVKTTVDGRMTFSVGDEPWRDAWTNACFAVAHDRPSCGWKAIGPFEGWRITPE